MTFLRRLIRAIRGSLALKLITTVVLVQGLLMALFLSDFVTREGAALKRHRIERAEGVAAMLATSGATWVLSEDLAGLNELSAAASSMKALKYSMFVAPDGRILSHSDRRQTGRYLDEEGRRILRGSGLQPRVVASSAAGVDVAAPVIVDGKVAGWTWVSMGLGDVQGTVRVLAAKAAAYGFIAILVGLLISLRVVRSVTRRIGDLAAVSHRFRLGERNVRIRVRGSDEVATAAAGINEMLQTVAETEDSLRDVQRIAHVGSWRFDPVGPKIHWSEQVFELFGYDPGGPQPTFEQVLGALSGRDQARIMALAATDDPRLVESFNLHVRRPDGSERICWTEVRTRPNPAGSGLLLMGVCQDITEREAAAAQLRQAQKMEAVGQLTGGLAHDFNNLLAITIGNLDLAADELPEGSATREAVDEALAAALRGSELTRQLLAFSRRQPLAPQTIDLNQLISRFSTLWHRTVGAEVTIRLDLAQDLWLTTVDPAQVESAMLNLVINARDAMPGGGRITVETRNVRFAPGGASDEDEADGEPGEYCVIAVSDNGSGMSPDTVARAFEPFFTTKGVGKGSGLGLSMIYGFAKQSGGQVKIYSETGHGTVVRLYLPRARDEAAAAVSVEAVDLPRSCSERILLVEDDEGVRRVAARQLEELGYEVLVATDAGHALSLLGDAQVDLLFTDIVMPGGMSGVELADRVRARYPKMRVLFTSGFTQPGTLGLDAGDALLSKPYRKLDLAVRLRQILDPPASAAARR